jgi:hypothetical protein
MIRRAYAVRLKQTQPEDDPEGFQRLRAAYEQALGLARQGDAIARTTLEADASRVAAQNLRADAEQEDSERVRLTGDEADQEPGASELEARHETLCAKLVSAIGDLESDPSTLPLALNEILTSEAMNVVAVHERTEAWLASLISARAPRSDVLVEPAMRFFGWNDRKLTRVNDPALRVLKRNEALAFFRLLRRSEHKHYETYLVLSSQPRAFSNRTTLRLPNDVRVLLSILDRMQPLPEDFDHESMAWWGNYFSKPQLPPGALWLTFLAPPVVAFVLQAAQAFGEPSWFTYLFSCLVTYVTSVLLAFGGLYALRAIWARRSAGAGVVQGWLRSGWAPASILLVLVAGIVPPRPLVLGAVALLGTAIVYWAHAMGERDREPGRFRWEWRYTVAFGCLAFYWQLIGSDVSVAEWAQLAFAFVTGAIAYGLGAKSLHDAWRYRLTDLPRRWALSCAGVLLAVDFLAGWECGSVPSFRGVTIALAGALAIAQKIPASTLQTTGGLGRDSFVFAIWLAWCFVTALLARQPVFEDRLTLLATIWLAGSAALSTVIRTFGGPHSKLSSREA